MDDKRFKAHYQHNEYFEICNPNPLWKDMRGMIWNKPDCVIRALANAVGLEWVDAFDYLVRKARRDFTTISDGTLLRKWLEEDGAKWTACKAVKGKKRMTAKDFAKSHHEGRYILRLANHECACVNGVLLDSWNCGEKVVFGFLDMADFDI